MKALSLTQPWASAICLGIKRWETRSWPTRFRGDFCLHASKGFPKWAREFAKDDANIRQIRFEGLPLGAIVAVCTLTECRQTDTVISEISELEQQWGDYTPGRYAFKLENVRVLTEPVPSVGHLSFWPVPWDPAKEVMRHLPIEERSKVNFGR